MKRTHFSAFVVSAAILFSSQVFAAPPQTFENQYQPVSDYARNKAATGSSNINTTTLTDSENETYDTKGGAVKFAFQYKDGDSYRILSTVNEDVYVNQVFDHSTEIINRVSCEVTSVDENGAVHNGTFMTSENSTGASGAHFEYGEDYTSTFYRDTHGTYTITDEFFMPTVRDVPSFPDRAISPGESWTAQGSEAHDLRTYFGMEKPYIVPFTATYTYLGTVTSEGKKLHVFTVSYSLSFSTPRSANTMPYTDTPTLMKGYSSEVIYWDAEKGAIDHYRENFRIIMETLYGNVFEFRGNAHAEVTDFTRTNTEENVDSVQKQIDEMGIDNVTVKQGEKGLTLSVEDIKFAPDSAELLPSELEKLQLIAEILQAFPDNDILVSGHTALAGTEKVRQRLSEERAQAVADYLIQLGVRDQYHIFTQGFGATRPIASNSTAAGKAKNRRVEITIMDK